MACPVRSLSAIDRQWLARKAGFLTCTWMADNLPSALAASTTSFVRLPDMDEQEMILYDKNGDLRFFQPTEPGADRPEVDRPDIRRILLTSVTPELIRWERVLTAIDQPTSQEPVTLHFRNAPSETFDLVIGADGAWSRVRPTVSASAPGYTGVTFHELHYTEAAAHDDELAALTRRGNMFALGDRKALNSHRTASGGVHVYAGMWTGDTFKQ